MSRRTLAVALAIALIPISIAAAYLLVTRPQAAAWGLVSSESSAIVIAVPAAYAQCDDLHATANESATQIVVRARVSRGFCKQKVAHLFPPTRVRLRGPLNGRAIVGPRRIILTPAKLATTQEQRAPLTPQVEGLALADAKDALNAAGYTRVNATGSGMVVTQTPAPGTQVAKTRAHANITLH